jgi:hypothetical protein
MVVENCCVTQILGPDLDCIKVHATLAATIDVTLASRVAATIEARVASEHRNREPCKQQQFPQGQH